jgi:hypothetical protein
MQRAHRAASGGSRRPVMLAIAGDSAAGKTTLTRGPVQSLGPERVTAVCVDDYHRYDREERRSLPLTPLTHLEEPGHRRRISRLGRHAGAGGAQRTACAGRAHPALHMLQAETSAATVDRTEGRETAGELAPL